MIYIYCALLYYYNICITILSCFIASIHHFTFLRIYFDQFTLTLKIETIFPYIYCRINDFSKMDPLLYAM